MKLILHSKARQFHRHQIGDRRQQNPFLRSRRLRKAGDWREVFRPHLLVYKHHVNRGAGARLLRVDEHIQAGGVTISKTEFTGGFRDSLQLIPINRDIDVLGRSTAPWPAHGDLEEDGKPADNAVRNPCGIEGLMKPLDALEELVHMSIVGARRNHSQS